MTLIQSIILGIVQGITEFLPVSSSGHLVIVPQLLGWQIPPEEAFVFDVLVQVATLLAVFAYFRQELAAVISAFLKSVARRQVGKDPLAKEGWFILLATIPAGIAGLLFKDAVESAFSSPVATAFSLFITAALLLIAERVGQKRRDLEGMSWIDALWIGLFQAIAVFPGVSRSGATMAGGMLRNFERPAAARFSFLLSIPIMLAAGLMASVDLLKIPNLSALLPVFVPGFVAAAIVGYLSIRWLLSYLSRRPLYVFSIYCIFAGLITLASVFLSR